MVFNYEISIQIYIEKSTKSQNSTGFFLLSSNTQSATQAGSIRLTMVATKTMWGTTNTHTHTSACTKTITNSRCQTKKLQCNGTLNNFHALLVPLFGEFPCLWWCVIFIVLVALLIFWLSNFTNHILNFVRAMHDKPHFMAYRT